MKPIKIIFLLLTFNIFAQTENSRLDDLRKLTKIDSTDKAVYNLLDDFYAQALQSDLGELKEDIPKKIEKLVGNKRTKNRHLLLMFFAYQVHIQQTLAVGKKSNPKFQTEIMNDLSVEFKNIFNKIPAIIYIYNFEALDLAGQNEIALKVLDEGLIFYPNSIPLKVYKYQKTKDETLKKELIENHSNHWMVKQFEI